METTILNTDTGLSKSDVITKVTTDTNKKRKDVKEIVDRTFDVIAETMVAGGSVTIQNFCRFDSSLAAARTYTIAKTERTGTVPERYMPKAHFSKTFVDSIKAALAR